MHFPKIDAMEIAGALVAYLNWFVTALTRFFSNKNYEKVPPIDETYKYLKISATELAEKIRNKEISSEEVVAEYIKRIKEVNPIINAVFEERFAKALEEAKEADLYIKDNADNDLKTTKPLFGLPMTIKESCVVKGLSLTGASWFRKGYKAMDDSVVVKKLKDAGAIILLVSATPEYCVSFETNNLINGITRNPYNTQKTCGGSSGGEGALLGAGASLIGIGSDIGGSIRIPAFFNGVFGHKPSKRLVYTEDHFIKPTDEKACDYLTMGPMTRYAKDMKLIMSVISPKEYISLKMNEEVPMSTLKIYTLEQTEDTPMLEPVQEEIKEAIRKAAKYLETKGSKILNYKFNLKGAAQMSTCVFYDVKGIPDFFQHKEHRDNFYLEALKSIFGISKYSFALLFFQFLLKLNAFIPKKMHSYYFKMYEDQKNIFKDKLGSDGVLLYPTFPSSSFYHGHAPLHIISVTYALLFNLLGLPACNVPMGFDKYGMPIGIQVIAGPNQDRLCLAVAEELEKGFGGWKQ